MEIVVHSKKSVFLVSHYFITSKILKKMFECKDVSHSCVTI